MKRRPLAILGAGPHGHQLAELFDDEYSVELFDDTLPGYRRISEAQGLYLIGAAWPKVREQIWLHSYPGKALDYGRVAFSGVQFGDNTYTGDHTHVMYNAVISHGCRIGPFVTVCAGVVLGGEVVVHGGVFIGANATVIHGGITIGRGAIIGAGAVVVEDVPEGATVVGNPARVIA